ncbi:MAG: NosD domain-containing protein [Pseudobdellovibrionaceae bacterium]
MVKHTLSTSAMFIALAAFAYGAGGVCIVPQAAYAASADTGIERLLLNAEAETDKEKSIQMLRALLGRDDLAAASASQPALSAWRIRAAIVENYLFLYRAEKDMDHLEKVQDFIRTSYSKKDEQAWAYLYVLGALADEKPEEGSKVLTRFAEELIDGAEENIKAIKDQKTREEIAYTFALVLTNQKDDKPVFDAQHLNMAHTLAVDMNDPLHRMQIMRRLAKAGKIIAGSYPALYAPVYKLLEEKKIDADDLIDIHNEALENDQFDLALTSLLVIKERGDRANEMLAFSKSMMEKNEISRARRIAEKIDYEPRAIEAWCALAEHYAASGYPQEMIQAYAKAEGLIGQITKQENVTKAHKTISDSKKRVEKQAEKKSKNISDSSQKQADIALKAIATGDVVAATEAAKLIADPIFRAATFRQIAETQTRRIDKFALLDKQNQNENPEWHWLKADEKKIGDADAQKLVDFEGVIEKGINTDPQSYTVVQAVPSSLGQRLRNEPLVERLTANGDTVRAAIPLPGDAEIVRSYFENNLFNSKFYEVYGNAGATEQQNQAAPEAIIIESGITDIPALYDELKDKGFNDYLVKEGGTYTLRRPLVVGPRAALVVTGDEVRTLKMSTEAGAYIVVSGKFYFSDSKLIGWSESKGEPQWAEYKDKRNFRPFITGWSQSEMYIADSEIVALGYGNGKSYGISFSAGPNAWFKFGFDPHEKRPTAIMTGNSIRNTLYGFYSYEADDVVLSGNEYIDNIVYGVDPHDRSHRLAIGYNTAYATHKKHGIIISREVNDSLIFGNITFENKGTGIMLDRDSNGTLVYGNTSFHNNQDGLTLFESDCEIVASNSIFENHGSGFRIRNSYNIGLFYNDLVKNNASGISAYEGTLKGDPAHKFRDFDLDPYDELAGVAAIGNRIDSNGTGLTVEGIDGLFLKGNEFVNQSPKILRGLMFDKNPEMLSRYDQKTNGVAAGASCPVMPEPLYVQSCKFRENGTLKGDGMDHLVDRIKTSACAKSVTAEKKTLPSEAENEEE